MTGITIYNVKRAVTPKAGNSDLWFLCSAHHIMVIYTCIKFQENISNSFQVTEQTHITEITNYNIKGQNSENRLSRLTVLEFCTLSLMLYFCVNFYQNT